MNLGPFFFSVNVEDSFLTVFHTTQKLTSSNLRRFNSSQMEYNVTFWIWITHWYFVHDVGYPTVSSRVTTRRGTREYGTH